MKIQITLIDMKPNKFISTSQSLAPKGWQKPKHILDALKKRRDDLARASKKKTSKRKRGSGG
jgi:hypothetical protein